MMNARKHALERAMKEDMQARAAQRREDRTLSRREAAQRKRVNADFDARVTSSWSPRGSLVKVVMERTGCSASAVYAAANMSGRYISPKVQLGISRYYAEMQDPRHQMEKEFPIYAAELTSIYHKLLGHRCRVDPPSLTDAECGQK